jgi:hypothetical protein
MTKIFLGFLWRGTNELAHEGKTVIKNERLEGRTDYSTWDR